MVDSLGTTTLAYDRLNRMISINDALGRTLQYEYDGVGNNTAIVYPSGKTARYTYLENNWLDGVEDTTGRMTRYSRDGVGNVTEVVHPQGTTSRYSYDDADRLRSITHNDREGGLVSSVAYTLDAVGSRIQAEFEYGRPWIAPVIENYTYDDLRRLVGMSDSNGYSTSYTYDKAGNRTKWVANDDRQTQLANDGFEVVYGREKVVLPHFV